MRGSLERRSSLPPNHLLAWKLFRWCTLAIPTVPAAAAEWRCLIGRSVPVSSSLLRKETTASKRPAVSPTSTWAIGAPGGPNCAVPEQSHRSADWLVSNFCPPPFLFEAYHLLQSSRSTHSTINATLGQRLGLLLFPHIDCPTGRTSSGRSTLTMVQRMSG